MASPFPQLTDSEIHGFHLRMADNMENMMTETAPAVPELPPLFSSESEPATKKPKKSSPGSGSKQKPDIALPKTQGLIDTFLC